MLLLLMLLLPLSISKDSGGSNKCFSGGNTFVREFFSGKIKNTTQATHSTSHLFPVETNYRPTWLSH